jgi:hypothetical protein
LNFLILELILKRMENEKQNPDEREEEDYSEEKDMEQLANVNYFLSDSEPEESASDSSEYGKR